MMDSVPDGARPVARVLLIGPEDRLLLFQAQDPQDGRVFWVTPGGGVEPGETFEQAARRELHEETGCRAPLGPWVWTRRHIFAFNGRRLDQYERFFVARTDASHIEPVRPDDYVHGHRWWSLPEIAASSEIFAPRRLAELVTDLLRGEYPRRPIDCGV